VKKFRKLVTSFTLAMMGAGTAFAEATSEADLGDFLEGVGDFLILIVGPAVLVIGVAVAGISMALGNDRGVERGMLAVAGGALIMLSRAVLDLISNVASF